MEKKTVLENMPNNIQNLRKHIYPTDSRSSVILRQDNKQNQTQVHHKLIKSKDKEKILKVAVGGEGGGVGRWGWVGVVG